MTALFPAADSNYSYIPVTLYLFAYGTLVYAYCSGDTNITFNSQLYTAMPITDNGFTQSGETSDDVVEISLPWTAGIVKLYNGTPPSGDVFVQIFRISFGETEATLAWSGTITEVQRPDDATATVNCETIMQSFERNGLTLMYSVSCPFFLYDPTTCKVDPLAFQATGIVTAVGGQTVNADVFGEQGVGYYAGGYVEYAITPDGETLERRPIQTHVGDQVTLFGTADGITVGMQISVYPGCDHTNTQCATKFNNIANCGCCPFLPGINPFDNVNVF